MLSTVTDTISCPNFPLPYYLMADIIAYDRVLRYDNDSDIHTKISLAVDFSSAVHAVLDNEYKM